jgi:hypothetical protein
MAAAIVAMGFRDKEGNPANSHPACLSRLSSEKVRIAVDFSKTSEMREA